MRSPSSAHPTSSPLRRLAAWGGLVVLLAAPGCVSLGAVETGEIHAGGAAVTGFSDDRDTVQMVSTVVGGKNVYIPSTVVLTAGSGRTLTIYNTTDKAHGFSIPALGVEAILTNGQETVVALPDLEAGHIYEIKCQLHPAHRHGTLMVVNAR